MYLIELQQISIKNSRKSAENWPKYREIPLFSQNREYLKITGNALSWARNMLETHNLDQRYSLEVSWRLQRDFSKFFAPFLGHFRPQIAILTPRRVKNGQKMGKILKNPNWIIL